MTLHHKPTLHFTVMVVMSLTLFVLLPGCGKNEQKTFEKAKAVSDKQALSKYLEDFPEGAHRAEAQKLIDKLKWQEAEKAGQVLHELFLREGKPVPVRLTPRLDATKPGQSMPGEYCLVFEDSLIGAKARIEMEHGGVLIVTVKSVDRKISGQDLASAPMQRILTLDARDGKTWLANLAASVPSDDIILTVRKLPDGSYGLTWQSRLLYERRFRILVVAPNEPLQLEGGDRFTASQLRFVDAVRKDSVSR